LELWRRNRIIVAALPTPLDKLRKRFSGGDVAVYGISITKENKQIADSNSHSDRQYTARVGAAADGRLVAIRHGLESVNFLSIPAA